ncbi:MAG: PEP/pyruvate-binding domain-containing protein [Micromonosporaceae bacterium]
MTATSCVRPLATLTQADVDRVGSKAALLGELLRAGFPVPDGYVIAAEHLPDAPPPGKTRIALPPEIVDELNGIAATTAAPLAVRSSAGAEDSAGASYAGQYESVLGVAGASGLVHAVETCVNSALADRVTVYQDSNGGRAPSRMSVLIQYLVDADAAGVAFTANPVTGDRGEVMINAVRGLGEKLVSGHVTPDQWSVRGGAATPTAVTDDAIDAAQAQAVAELARQVEEHFGGPQDIEWAITGGVPWLLQARPITALPDPPEEQAALPVEVPDGVWQRSNYAPEPLSPMFRSLMLPGLTELSINLFPYGIGQRLEFCEIGGWMYAQFVKLTQPRQIVEKLTRAAAAARADAPSQFYRDYYDNIETELTARITQLTDHCDPAQLDDTQLLRHVNAVLTVWQESVAAHFQTGGSGTFVLGEIGIACRDLLGWDAPEALTLLLGLQGKTTEPAYRLAELAQQVRQRPETARLVEQLSEAGEAELVEPQPPEAVLAQLRELDAEFAGAFQAYQREYGRRTLGMDITEPTVAERPVLVLNLIRGQLGQSFDPAADKAALVRERTRAEEAAHEALAEQSAADRERFNHLLKRAQWASPARDDSHYLTQVAGGLVRRAVLELGARLAANGLVDSADDVFFLEYDEAVGSLRDGGERHELVKRRRAERTWALAHPGPKTYGAEEPEGDIGAKLAKLPPEVQRILQVGFWAWREVSGERADGAHTEDDARTLHGIAGSRGRYTGPVRVITTEAEFDKLRPGDVLVCPETNPQWAVLFPSVGALVTDHGGLLSHPAIIAREYRVPAVLATDDATSRLYDGQVVTVDGSTGVVEIVAP